MAEIIEIKTLTKNIIKQFKFMNNVKVKIINKNGRTRAQVIMPKKEKYTLYLYLKQLRGLQNLKRFKQLLGKTNNFKNFYIKVLLHEICHIKQFKRGNIYDTTNLSPREHDNDKSEIEANKFAITNFKKVLK